VVISYAFLWLTVLSPHDVVFTAYLKTASYKEWELGVFRGVGALFGVVSTFMFPWAASKFGVPSSSMVFILFEGVTLAGAGVLIHFLYLGDYMRYFFLVAIVFSRLGLYGFGIGEVQLLQLGVPESLRGQIGSMETSLTSVATLICYIGGIICSTPENFVWLMYFSIGFVNAGVLCFALWNCIWYFHSMMHNHASGDHEDPHHLSLHTDKDKAVLTDSGGMHNHPHFHRRGAKPVITLN